MKHKEINRRLTSHSRAREYLESTGLSVSVIHDLRNKLTDDKQETACLLFDGASYSAFNPATDLNAVTAGYSVRLIR